MESNRTGGCDRTWLPRHPKRRLWRRRAHQRAGIRRPRRWQTHTGHDAIVSLWNWVKPCLTWAQIEICKWMICKPACYLLAKSDRKSKFHTFGKTKNMRNEIWKRQLSQNRGAKEKERGFILYTVAKCFKRGHTLELWTGTRWIQPARSKNNKFGKVENALAGEMEVEECAKRPKENTCNPNENKERGRCFETEWN